MESWNHLLHTALLGTEKSTLLKEKLEADLQPVYEQVVSGNTDREEVFLQIASVLYNYRQSGYEPADGSVTSILPAGAEEKAYASPEAHRTLYAILESGSSSLLQLWLQLCAGADRIVLPDSLPLLLDMGQRHKMVRQLVLQCGGKRAAWLLGFNSGWDYGSVEEEEAEWETGTPEQRKNILAGIRKKDPAKGLQLLQKTWAVENAATRADLVSVLSIGLSESDLPALEAWYGDKSIKVRHEVLHLLKRLPASSVVQLYWRLLAPSIELVEEKKFLGLSRKTSIRIFPLKEDDPALYKTGIEKMSSEKNVADHAFLLYQVLMAVPPSFIGQHLGLSKEEVIRSIQDKNLLPAIGQAAVLFGETDWLRAYITFSSDKQFFADALDLLPQEEAEAYALDYLANEQWAPAIVAKSVRLEREWSLSFAEGVLQHTAKNFWQYGKPFYNGIVPLLPLSLSGGLEKFTPREEYNKASWNGLSAHIEMLLHLKQETYQNFNS